MGFPQTRQVTLCFRDVCAGPNALPSFAVNEQGRARFIPFDDDASIAGGRHNFLLEGLFEFLVRLCWPGIAGWARAAGPCRM